MTTMTVTLDMDAEHITALETEAAQHAQPLEVYLAGVLRRRVERPGWPERAEAAALADQVECLSGQLDRARDTAVRHEGEAEHLQELLDGTTATVMVQVTGLPADAAARAVRRLVTALDEAS